MNATPQSHDRWTHRLGVLALVFAVPLVLFGGSVTTLGAGMAVEGWLIAEGHFLLFFPVESWLRDTATFVEHTHRLFGTVVGAFAVAAVARALWVRKSGGRAPIAMPLIALAAVCGQGALGGFRVLENSQELAFLHGVFAQATFALLALSALVMSPRWRGAGAAAVPARVGRIALLASLVVFAQVSLGAWYRHGLRAEADGGSELRFALHFLGAAVTTALVVMLATSLKRAANEIGASSAVADALRGVAKRLHLLLGLQLLLGLAAWAGYREGAIGPAEWSLSILHVLTGAMLLAQCAVAFAWSRRAHAAPESLGAMALGGAR